MTNGEYKARYEALLSRFAELIERFGPVPDPSVDAARVAAGALLEAWNEEHPLAPCPRCGWQRYASLYDGACTNLGRCPDAPPDEEPT